MAKRGAPVIAVKEKRGHKKGDTPNKARRREAQQVRERENEVLRKLDVPTAWEKVKGLRKKRREEQGYPQRHALGTCNCKKERSRNERNKTN